MKVRTMTDKQLFSVGAVALGAVSVGIMPAEVAPSDSEPPRQQPLGAPPHANDERKLRQTVQRLVSDMQSLLAGAHLVEECQARIHTLEERVGLIEVEGRGKAAAGSADVDSDDAASTGAVFRSVGPQPADVAVADEATALKGAYARATEICRELRRIETEAPLNFHQATSFYCLQPSYPLWRKFVWFGASMAIAGVQVFAATSIVESAIKPLCVRNADCLDGQFCHPEDERCRWCGVDAESLANTSNSTIFCDAYPAHFLCEACIELAEQIWLGEAKDHGWSPVTENSFALESIDAMFLPDWVAFGLASLVLAMELSAEHRDIVLRGVASKQFPISRGWSFAMWALDAVRRYTVTNILVWAVYRLVQFRGSSTFDIVFNALALLFILAIDNSIYSEMLPEATKNEVEAFGRATLDTEAQRLLSGTRSACICCFAMAPLIAAACSRARDSALIIICPLSAFAGVRASWLEGASCVKIAAGPVFGFILWGVAFEMIIMFHSR